LFAAQFGIYRPGEMPTVYGPVPLPEILVNRTVCDCRLLFPAWLAHRVEPPHRKIPPPSDTAPVQLAPVNPRLHILNSISCPTAGIDPVVPFIVIEVAP